MVLALHPLCAECEAHGRTTPATDVDHVIDRAARLDLELDQGNLRALCHACHSRKTAGTYLAGGISVKVTVVAGPPGSGKSTYVRERMKRGDLLVDVDLLMSALSGEPPHATPGHIVPFALAAREAVLKRLLSPSGVGAAWVIGCLPRAAERQQIARSHRASVVVLETPADVCKERIAEAEDRQAWPASTWTDAIDQWWIQYERRPEDKSITDS